MNLKSGSYILFFLLVSALFSCEKTDVEFEDDFRKSERAWQDFKKSSGNTYKYVVSFQSWAGFGSETTITVADGKVIRREYLSVFYDREPGGLPKVRSEWVEDANEIGTNTNDGALPFTLDEVYEKSKNEWLVKRDKATTYFRAENAGMISTAGYVEDGCADDCFVGMRISAITAGN